MVEARVVRIPLRFANSYLVIGEKTIIVDSGDPGFSRGILQAMEKNEVKKTDISLIFITHGHIDHYGSVFELKREIDAPIAIHRLDAPYFNQGIQAPLYPLNPIASAIKLVGKNLRVKKRYGIKADIEFKEKLELQEFGVQGLIIPTPGHTLGSASLFLPDKRAITGDLIVWQYLFRGKPRPAPFLHDRNKFVKSINILKGRGIKTIYPGHGPSIDTSDIRIKN
ncbi:MAG TPA: MBL fold metallo-hydrolase [Gelria sp.]|jgi:glyoxylase-like metal-dependent hydrolase (beta-lactamase superfamily II)|nr:MBL fold metallo-hydrolase [Gelria sp.]